MGYFDGLNLQLLVEPPAPPEKSGVLRRAVGDLGVTAVKAAIGLPEMAVGLGSLASGGRVGKLAEEAGFRPKEAREYLDTLYSPEQQAANREVQQAEGFFDTAYAALRNPSTIAHAVLESAPSMLGAAGITRGLMGLAVKPGLAAAAAAGNAAAIKALKARQLIAVGAGEGIFSAGSAAEQIRQQTDDGRLTAEQSLIVAGSSALTGLIVGVAGKLANKLGIGDVQQMLAGVQQAGPKAEKALTRALLEGFATEGILQELPQSAQEQIAQNVALGRPWDEGVGNAAAMGTLAGGVTGVGGAAWAWRMRREPEQTEDDPIAESNAKASEAMDRLATVGTVAEMAKAAADVVDSSTLGPLGISAEQEARVMQAGEELAQADLTSIKNMGRLDRTRSPEPPAPIVPASEEGPAPFLDRLLTATEALQDPAVRQRVEQAAGPQYLAQLDQYAKVANTPGFMDGIGDQVRDRHLELLERAVFPDRFRQPAPPVQRAERRKSDPVPIEPFRAEPVTDPVLDYVEAKRAENTMAARAFVKEFEAGRITRRDVVRVMQDRNADPLGSNPDPLASIQPATPAPNLIQQRLEAAARAGQAQPTGIQIEPSRARPKGQSDERNPERAVPGEGRPVDAGNQPGTSGVVQGELQQPGAPGPSGAPVPSAVQGVDAERAGRGLGDDALTPSIPAPKLPKEKRGERFDSAEFADAISRLSLPNGMRFDPSRDRSGGFTGRVRIVDGGGNQNGHIDFNYNHVSGEVVINKSELVEALRGKGVGKAAYVALNNALVASGLPPLASDANNLSQSALRMWRSLVRDGLAVERADGRIGYSFVDAVNARTTNATTASGTESSSGGGGAADQGIGNARLTPSMLAATGDDALSGPTPAQIKLQEAIAAGRPLGVQTHGDGSIYAGATAFATDMVRLDMTPAERKQFNQAQALEQLAETQEERDEARRAVQTAVAGPAARAAKAAPTTERGLGDDALSGGRVDQLAAVFKRVADEKLPGRDNSETAQRIAAELAPLIDAKNADALIARNLGSADMNPASRAVFEAATGVKLPKGRAATEAAIDQWAGVTPEVRAEREAKRKALLESKKADDASKFARQAAERIQVNTPDGQLTGGAYVDDLISKGFDRIVARGPKTFLANSDGNGFPLPHVDLAGYARKAVAARATSSAQAQAGRAGRGLGDDALSGEPAAPTGGFDSEAWDKARNERIEASRNAGNVHLDKVPAYVESMRGKRIFYVHDEKVQGVIRTVDNRGNVYVDWADAYSAEKELASPTQEGRKTVFRSSIGQRDLKDYALQANKAPTSSAQAQAGTPAEGAGTTRPMPGQDAMRLADRSDAELSSIKRGQQALLDAMSAEAAKAVAGKQRGDARLKRESEAKANAARLRIADIDAEVARRQKPADQAAILPLDQAANEAATSPQNDLPEPTEAQKEAGNYRVGRIKVAGLDISVENPAGSERSGIDPDGKKWRNKLAHHYGYIRRSEGADGDHVDVFVNPGTPEDYDGQVFVVDQADPKTGRFDEHKVMMGFPSAKAAQEAYQANYAKDWTGLRAVQPMTMEQFKAWVSDPANTKKPAAKGVKPGKGEKVERPDELVELRKRESALKSLRECLG